MSLPDTNPLCSGDKKFGSIVATLFANNFETILLKILHQLIGLNCSKLLGLSTFGIGIIKVLIHGLGNIEPTKNSEIHEINHA